MMNDKPERIWATGNYETGSWNAIEGRMKSHMPDGWQTEYVRATDYDALAAKLAEVESALPAVYRLAWEDAYQEYPFNAPTPTAAELMAIIQTGEKE